jgi:hypothetical protein
MQAKASPEFPPAKVSPCPNLISEDLPDVGLSDDSAFSRVCGAKGVVSMKKQTFRERECLHREAGTEGDFYNGVFYVQAIQRLSAEDALKVAGKISPFYWIDAPHILVWLCDSCAAELHLNEAPRALVHSARR